MTTSVAIGIDLGGTNLKGAAVDQQGHILARQVHPAHADRGPDAVVDEMVQLINELVAESSLTRSELVGVGVGAPGPLSVRDGRIIHAVNLTGWQNVPLRDLLRDKLDTIVVLDNDGNAAAYGEFWTGVGREVDDLVMLTLGTGVGAGVIMNGRVVHGHFENAAEIGHMIVVPNGLPCRCGQKGCLERYASAAAVARRVVAAIEHGRDSELARAVRAGGTIDAAGVAQCAERGDALCAQIWDEACLYLALTCINIQHAFNPACIVLGGGMSRAGGFLLDRVTRHFDQQKWSLHDDFPAIALARLGYDAGVIGAAGLVWRGRNR